jgi:hypothetical protein
MHCISLSVWDDSLCRATGGFGERSGEWEIKIELTIPHFGAHLSLTLQFTIMTAISSTAKKQEKTTHLRDFALSFFETFDAPVKRLDRRKQGALLVELPEQMAAHFGREELRLVFQNAEATSESDLVAYGSRVFDQMMAFLDRQGALTVQELPARHIGADELLRAVQPLNAAIAGLQLSEQKRQLFVFNWHITYRADDKREEIFTVVVDDQGQRVALTDGEAEQEAGTGAVDLQTLLADAQPVPTEMDADGHPLPARLPPMTQLTRLAESARKHALYHADVRCVGHEAEILPRLHKVLARLVGYYQQQIEEVYDSHDPTGEKRQLLEEDLQRKIAEEVENHRLRVDVRLFSYALLSVPVANAQIRLSDARREVTIDVTRNRYTGAIRRPPCHSCATPITGLMLCRNGHITCQNCILQCQICQDVLCETCGLYACPQCGQENCESCSRYCWACGERACPEHISYCPVCGDETCHTCQAACSECGQRQCRTHLRVDGVSGQLLCSGCAVRCPGCSEYSSQLETCAVSGQRFCVNCIVPCAGCTRPLGPGLYTVDPIDGRPYCTECLTPCPACGKQTAVLVDPGCATCGRVLCGHCRIECHTCGDLLCAEHEKRCADCDHSLCRKDLVTCQVGGELLCMECAQPCAICGVVHCLEHSATCAICLQRYCASCVDPKDLCETCTSLPGEGREVAMVEEPIFYDPRIENIWNRHYWIAMSNRRYTLYLGVDTWNRYVLVVAEGEKVLHLRRGQALGKLFGHG